MPDTNEKKGRFRQATYDHLGNCFPSITAMCRHYGMSYQSYTERRKKGMPLEQALTEPTSAEPVEDHLGTEYPSMNAMAKAWGISLNGLRKRLENGMPLEEALTRPKKDTAPRPYQHVDHLGGTYRTFNEMAEHWGITPSDLRGRLKAGWDMERALTEPVVPMPTYTAPDGTTHTSRRKFAEYCGIPYAAADAVASGELTVDQAKKKLRTKGGPCEDHNGREWPSESAMLTAYGTNWACYRQRQAQGWSLERNLTERPFTATDPEGRTFSDCKSMAEAWGIRPDLLRKRLMRGVPLAQALLPWEGNGSPCRDHTGQEFPSVNAMVRHWGHEDASRYTSRIKDGWSMKDALETPPEKKRGCTDHLGQHYARREDMCAAWGITLAAYKNRQAMGMPLEAILTWKPDQTPPDPDGNIFPSIQHMADYWFCTSSTIAKRLENRSPKNAWTWPQQSKPLPDVEVLHTYGQYLLVRIGGNDYMLPPEALHAQLCRMELKARAIDAGTDPRAAWLAAVLGRGYRTRKTERRDQMRNAKAEDA